MKNDRLIPGTIIACIGAILLLSNFNVIDLNWMNVLHLWPVFLIMGGVNLVFAGNRSAVATIIKLTVVIAGFALLVFGHFGNRFNFWPGVYNLHINDNDNDNDDSDTTTTDSSVVKIQGNSVFNKAYSPDAKLVRLNISGGATSYTLNDTTSQLFKAETKEFYGKYEFTSTKEDSVDVLNLRMKNNKGGWHFDADDDKSNKAVIRLNPNPVYDIHVEAGAAEVNFDLSKFKIKNVNLAGGAASFDIKLGEPLETTNVQVSNAASGVTISIPKDAACKITTTGFMSSDDFDGFIKKGDKDYETANFGSAKNKIIINMSGVASGFEVKRY